MFTVTHIAESLALGAAAAAGKGVVSGLVKDAYERVKGLITSRYSSVPLNLLEKTPESVSRRGVVEEELQALNAERDDELVTAARHLLEMLRQHNPVLSEKAAVVLRNVESTNLRVREVTADGQAVLVDGAKVSQDIEISGIKSGSTDPDKKKP